MDGEVGADLGVDRDFFLRSGVGVAGTGAPG